MTENTELKRMLMERYDISDLCWDEWEEITLWGGVAMDALTFSALSDTARTFGDKGAKVYVVESTKTNFQPLDITLNFESFKKLNHEMISFFDLCIVPNSRAWVAWLVNYDMETHVYAAPSFVSSIGSKLMDIK